MSHFPLGYEQIPAATWVYVSSLLMIGLFFKFSRAWSIRNVDLILLVLLSPGLLLVHFGRLEQQEEASSAIAPVEATVETSNDLLPIAPDDRDALAPGSSGSPPPADSDALPIVLPDPLTVDGETVEESPVERVSDVQAITQTDSPTMGARLERNGFFWLLGVAVIFLVRMLIDPMMVRRPMLEPNLTAGGLAFIGCALFVFLMANVISGEPTSDDLSGPENAAQWVAGQTVDENDDRLSRHGPGYPMLHVLPVIITTSLVADKNISHDQQQQLAYVATAKTMAILAHLAVVIGIIMIGYLHFDNIKMGVGVALIYLMLPYTAQMTGRVDHVLPAALLVWAVLFYRRPLASGTLLGLAIGVVYYPLFLLPLWVSFYWHRGLTRFVLGMALMLGAMIITLAYQSSDVGMFFMQLQQMFGVRWPKMEGLQGVWGPGGWYPEYRIPVLAAFITLVGVFAFWPAQKNLGTLLSCSSAIMIATQFWNGFGGGLYIAWYLPLALLTFFRPNLEDRVALSVLGKGWFPLRRNGSQKPTVDKAA